MLTTLLGRRQKQPTASAITPIAPPVEVATPSAATAQLNRIACASVTLAALGPKLATFAAEMERQAKVQASRANTISATMDAVAQDLENAVSELRSSSGQLQETLKAVERIADHTRLLSINASIEAARAGEQGRVFAVVVDEVKRLAESSGQSTRLIEDRMAEIGGCVSRVAAVTRTESAKDADEADRTVVTVNREVRGMAHSAGLQLQSAASVHSMGTQINQLTESLLLAVGKFRFEAHSRAQQAVEHLVPTLIEHMPRQAPLEQVLAPFLQAHPYFELGYITDISGRQIIDNLSSRDGLVIADSSGFGREWSDRPWFRAALSQSGACSTDVYRSTATGDYCFTIAIALRTLTQDLLGVLACDVNFQRLVSE
jgi:hypothetical protein